MQKLLPLILVLGLVLAACGGDDDDDNGDVSNIADATTCEQVGDIFISDLQTLLDELSDVSLSEFEGGQQPEAMTQFEQDVDEISSKSDELGCTDEQIQEELTDRVNDLTAEGPVAELILQGFQEAVNSGDFFQGVGN